MSKRAFSMIELVFAFAIVIVAILAAIIIPKLAITRDDAKISKITNDIQSAKNEILSYVIAKGSLPHVSLSEISNVIYEMDMLGEIGDDLNETHVSFMVGSKDNKQECISFDLNSTDMLISQNPFSKTSVCEGIKKLIPSTKIPIGGISLTY